MILINKHECEELQKRGFSFQKGDIHHTIGKGNKKTYYATESEKLMRTLNKMRSND